MHTANIRLTSPISQSTLTCHDLGSRLCLTMAPRLSIDTESISTYRHHSQLSCRVSHADPRLNRQNVKCSIFLIHWIFQIDFMNVHNIHVPYILITYMLLRWPLWYITRYICIFPVLRSIRTTSRGWEIVNSSRIWRMIALTPRS